jgi:TatA/E family protein of Tat protein translocase
LPRSSRSGYRVVAKAIKKVLGGVMFGLSLGHLVILMAVVLLFGHRRLPELGRALGKGLGAFKKGLEGKNPEQGE